MQSIKRTDTEKNCSKLKNKKKEPWSEANIAQANGIDFNSSIYLVYYSTVCYSNFSECILNMSATYHVCPKREWFARFEKLDVSFGDGHTCHIEEITIRIKMFDGTMRELQEVRYVP